MRLAVILPGELPGEAKAALQQELEGIRSADTETAFFDAPGTIMVSGDIDLMVPRAVEAARRAEAEGFDAIVMHGT